MGERPLDVADHDVGDARTEAWDGRTVPGGGVTPDGASAGGHRSTSLLRSAAITPRRGNATSSATRTRSPLAHSGPSSPAAVPRVVAATRGPTTAPALSAAVA